MNTLIYILFLATLAVVSLQDIRSRRIPNGCVLFLCLLAVLSEILSETPEFSFRLVGAISVSVPLLCVSFVTNGAIGAGDVKLTAAGGLFLGWRLMIVSAVIAFFLAGIYSAVVLALQGKIPYGELRGRKAEIALGPFLCAGMVIGSFWGNDLINWYVNSPFG